MGSYLYYGKTLEEKGVDIFGLFQRSNKGEKDWGSILTETYQSYTVPIIHNYIELQRRAGIKLVLIQDRAPSHAAANTRKDLKERGVIVIYWPLFSPNLNPIGKVQHIIKNYPENISYDQLRAAVKVAQEKAGSFKFKVLINSMLKRCQAVIDAEGQFIKYQIYIDSIQSNGFNNFSIIRPVTLLR